MTTDADHLAMDSQKYRLPEHTNGNGIKAMASTKQAYFERIISRDENESPPPPLPKDTPPVGATSGEFDASSYFNPVGLQRAGSICTLSRASFACQLAQLTSLQLPDAESLSTKVAAIPTSKAASRTLRAAADQIRSWISKASEVISGLNGDDDVEWAAAGGREGLEEVDNAIKKFEKLITVFVAAIDSLQQRRDVATLQSDELKLVVLQVETILSEWEKIKDSLKAVKNLVELAMEWEELWNVVLGDIGNEIDILSRLVFEMEEKRHQSLMAEVNGDGVDLNELETIVEETPPSKTRLQANTRFSVLPPFPLSPDSPTTPVMTQDDSSLLALFARMQPLRASLDFLPMRLSTFHVRADTTFPTACEELETKRSGLETSWKMLEKDAELLRKELGEDRWVLVFRGAGRQALKMCESVERSLTKLIEAVNAGPPLNSLSIISKKIEGYEAKKTHYGPAIERVLTIIEKGVKDRLTVNGEILRLHSDMQNKWEKLKEQLHELDSTLEDVQADRRNQQLRDSISSIVSNDRSTLRSFNETPGSSPASSVVMGLNAGLDPITCAKGKPHSAGRSSLPQPGKRISSLPSSSSLPRTSLAPRLSSLGIPSPSVRHSPGTPTGYRTDPRPPWNASVNTRDISNVNNLPSKSTTPSPHARGLAHSSKSYRMSNSAESKIPLFSRLGRENTAQSTPSRMSSPGPYAQENFQNSAAAFRARNLSLQHSKSALSNRCHPSPKTNSSNLSGNNTPETKVKHRPVSSMDISGRTSYLPTPTSGPRGRNGTSVTGRESPHAIAGAVTAMRRNSDRVSMDSKGNVIEKKPWK